MARTALASFAAIALFSINRQEESAFLPLAAVIPFIGRRAIPYARTPTAREENR
jgi:hypothetical protein